MNDYRILSIPMKTRPDRAYRRPSSSSQVRQEPLTDRRFEDLLRQASAFFAESEVDPEAERQTAIAEIIETLGRYGLTVEDLRHHGS